MRRTTHRKSPGPALLIGCLVLAAVAAGCATNRPLAEQVDDSAVTAKVKAKIAADPEINPFNIDVDTQEGVVRLSGTVDDAATRREAVKLASQTDGVRRVVNEIEVGEKTVGETLDDAAITAKIKAKITADGDLNPFNIDVDTQNGVVTLSGVVKDESHRQQAIAIARGTDGVREVRNRLEIRTGAAGP
jgi:hyperosmotically inducible protein